MITTNDSYNQNLQLTVTETLTVTVIAKVTENLIVTSKVKVNDSYSRQLQPKVTETLTVTHVSVSHNVKMKYTLK